MRRRVRVVPDVTAIVARGPRRVETLEIETPRGSQILSTDLLVLHQGMVPDINLGSALGCAHRWNDAQACFEPVVDAWGGSTLPGVFFAGDAAGVAGADAAEPRGQLAALAVANALGRIDAKARDAAAVKPRASLTRALRGRAFLDALHRPADAYRIPRGATVVCRCENVTAEQVIDALRGGAAGPNQVKAFTRCGMGPCQGRFCGLTVTELVARERRNLCGPGGIFPAALAGETDYSCRACGDAELGGGRARGRARHTALNLTSEDPMSISQRTPSARGARNAPRALFALLAAVLVAGGTSTTALAQGKDDLWEITTKMEMPGMPMAMPAQTQRLCIAKSGKDDDYIPKREGCRVQDSKRVGNKVSYKMVCTGKDSDDGRR